MKPLKKMKVPHHAVTLYRGAYGEDSIAVHAWVTTELFVEVDIVTLKYPKDALMRRTLDSLIGTAVLECRKHIGARMGGDE